MTTPIPGRAALLVAAVEYLTVKVEVMSAEGPFLKFDNVLLEHPTNPQRRIRHPAQHFAEPCTAVRVTDNCGKTYLAIDPRIKDQDDKTEYVIVVRRPPKFRALPDISVAYHTIGYQYPLVGQKLRFYSGADIFGARVGDVLTWEYPMTRGYTSYPSWEVITDGWFTLPWTKPHGKDEWSEWASIQPTFGKVDPGRWKAMTQFLEGKFYRDVVGQSDVIPRALLDAAEGRSGQSKKVNRSHVFTGRLSSGEASVAEQVGDYTLYSFSSGGTVRAVVAEYSKYSKCGGLYVFRTVEQAKKWALRMVDFNEARETAVQWFEHKPDGAWIASFEQCVRELLA